MSSQEFHASGSSVLFQSYFALSSECSSERPIINGSTFKFSSLDPLPVLEKLDTRSFANMFDTIKISDFYDDEATNSRKEQPSSCATIPNLNASTSAMFSDVQSLASSDRTVTQQQYLPQVEVSSPMSSIKAASKTSPLQLRHRSDTSSTCQSKQSEIFSEDDRKSSISTDVSSSEHSARESEKEESVRLPKRRWSVTVATSANKPSAIQRPQFGSLSKKDKPLPLPPLSMSAFSNRNLQKDPQTLMRTDTSRRKQFPLRDKPLPSTIGNNTEPQSFEQDSHLIRQDSQHSCSSKLETATQLSLSVMRVSSVVNRKPVPFPKSSSVKPFNHSRHPKIAIWQSENVALMIMQQVSSIDELQNVAMTNKNFYQTLCRNEIPLVSNALYKTSIAAWELRQSVEHSVKPSPFRMKSLQRDIATIRALEAFIVMNCRQVCRAETITALLDQNSKRKIDMEDAIWRIWTFCKLFGKGASPCYSFSKQIQWLNGTFDTTSRKRNKSAYGTKGERALTTAQLEDMSEIWRCMEHLLAGFQAQEKAARKAGLFSRCDLTDEVSETSLLNAWIKDILSLGPKAVLTLVSCDFEQAKVLGVTRWTPSISENRDTFLRAAIEEVYRERLVADAQRKAANFKRAYTVSHAHHRSASDSIIALKTTNREGPPLPPKDIRLNADSITRRKPVATLSARPENQFEIRPDCDPLSAIPSTIDASYVPQQGNSIPLSILSMNPRVSTRLGPSLFPDNEQRRPQILELRSSAVTQECDPSVTDPSDKAFELLTRGMNYPEASARRALAMSDTGNGIVLQKAIELLSNNFQSRGNSNLVRRQIAELPGNANDWDAIEVKHSSHKVISESNNQRVSSRSMISSQSMRLLKRGRSLSARMSMKQRSMLSVIPDDEEAAVESTSENEETVSRTNVPHIISQDSFRSNGGGNRVSVLDLKDQQNKAHVPDFSWKRAMLHPDILQRITRHSSESQSRPNNIDTSNRSVSPLPQSPSLYCGAAERRSSSESSSSDEEVPTNVNCMPNYAIGLSKVSLMKASAARSSSVMSWRKGTRKEKANRRIVVETSEVSGFVY